MVEDLKYAAIGAVILVFLYCLGVIWPFMVASAAGGVVVAIIIRRAGR
jgi:cytochrome c biogenesis protein CcdA